MTSSTKEFSVKTAILQLRGYKQLISDEIKTRVRVLEKYVEFGDEGIPQANKELFERILRNPLEGI